VSGETAPDVDHFVDRDGMRFAGTHLIVDLWHASELDDVAVVEAALRNAAQAAGATLLNVDLHCFTPNGAGVAVLAESHISVHTCRNAPTPRSTCSCAATPSLTRPSRCFAARSAREC
jgi:S-adenosylmethionine decarboxylase